MTTVVNIQSDSLVYQQGQGYERLMLINAWNPEDPRQLARVWIRVDRNPGESFARADIYTLEGGFQQAVMLPVNDWWTDMPGYLRWANDNSRAKTHQLATRIVERLQNLAGEVDL